MNMLPWIVIVVVVVCVVNNSLFNLYVFLSYQMKIAVIGQSLFGQEVYKELKKDGHMIVGVFTIPDKDGKIDPLGKSLFL